MTKDFEIPTFLLYESGKKKNNQIVDEPIQHLNFAALELPYSKSKNVGIPFHHTLTQFTRSL